MRVFCTSVLVVALLVSAMASSGRATVGYVHTLPTNTLFFDDFERGTIAPWGWSDGSPSTIRVDHNFFFEGNSSLKLSTLGTLDIQDARLSLPNPSSGIVGLEVRFAFSAPGLAYQAVLVSLEQRESAISNQLQELQLQYGVASGLVELNKPGNDDSFRNVAVITPKLSGVQTTPSLDFNASSGMRDRFANSWHSLKFVVNINTGEYISYNLDNLNASLTSYGTGQWRELSNHKTTANTGMLGVELHAIRRPGNPDFAVWYDNVLVTDENSPPPRISGVSTTVFSNLFPSQFFTWIVVIFPAIGLVLLFKTKWGSRILRRQTGEAEVR